MSRSILLRFAALSLLLSAAARAAAEPCSTGSPTFACRLQGILQFLSATAAVLGVLLLLTILVAVWFYRRTRDSKSLP